MHHRRPFFPSFRLLLCAAASLAVASTGLVACGDDDGTGTVQVETWGEEFIEQGIPAAELEDGWAVTFHAFVVTLGDVTAAGETFPGYRAVDLTAAGPHDLVSGEASTGPIAPAGYTIAPVDADTTNVNVDSALFDTMVAEGYSVWVEGEATKDASTITFAWGFDGTYRYTECHATGDVEAGDTGTVQLTIHGDHLLYESLVDPEAKLRFQVIVDADADADGEVTPAELAAFAGTDFQALDHYDVPAGSGIDNLWDYLAAQVATVGHIDGEGHCHM